MPVEALAGDRDVCDALIDVLADAGVEYVLGMPGGLTGPLFEALHGHPSIRTIQVREESIGSSMAEAYGRLTGRPLAVIGQGEWIVGNAGQGFLEALLGSSPLVILTEMSDGGRRSHHAPYQSGTGDYGTWDARTALSGVTKRVMVSHDPGQAVQHVQLALKHALTGEPGPVAVLLHSSALRGSVGPTTTPRIFATSGYLPKPNRATDLAAIDAAAAVLRSARQPMIIAGNGVQVGQAWRQLAEFAHTLDIPVATTSSGKGVFVEVDPLAAGVIGAFGSPVANALVGDADVVLAVGTKLGPHDTANGHPDLLDPRRQTLIQIDVEPLNAGWTFPVEHVLIGDAATVLDRLGPAVGSPPTDRPPGTERVARARDRFLEPDSEDAAEEAGLLAPRDIVSTLQESLPGDVIISCDAGENRLFMLHWYRTKNAGGYIQPAAGGGMGSAVPGAMAAKLSDPSRPALAVCGDGGFAMSLHALMTAVQEDLPIAVLILNNGALGWVLHGMGERAVAASFASFDHVAIARAIGCEALRVDTLDALHDALAKVGAHSRPYVIDVPASLATSFRELTQHIGADRRATGY